MSCKNCCENPLSACPPACSTFVLNTGILAPSDGTYTAQTWQFGQLLEFTQDRLTGQPISFAIQGLNEAKQFDFTLLDPTMQALQILGSDGTIYDCIRIETSPFGASIVNLQIP